MQTPIVGEEEINRFYEDGFLFMKDFLDENLLQNGISRLESVFSGEFETGVVPDKIKRLDEQDQESAPLVMCNIWKSDRALANIVLAEKIGVVVSKLMGWPGARCNQDSLIWLPAGIGAETGTGVTSFHQDNSYQDWHDPDGVITCWIPLEKTTSDGGTLEYVRGSHKWPISPRVKQFMTPDDYKAELKEAAQEFGRDIDIVPVELSRGDVSFHHGATWHGSNHNLSSNPRIAMFTHYMSSESKFHPSIPSPVFSHYKKFNDLSMDESFFPIVWAEDGKRSSFIDGYVK